MKNIIVTGSTGMVGKSILLEAIEDTRISSILLINRSSITLDHPKVVQLLVNSFEELPNHKDRFRTFDACFHCMGISSVGMNEEDYHYTTFELTNILIDTIYEANPNMVVNYVSGVGTDSTEKGKIMWARIKGRTENMILARKFKDSYMIRLGAILPEKGIKSKTGWYNTLYMITKPLFPLMKKSNNIITTTNFGKAMINTLFHPQPNKLLDNKDLNRLASFE